MIRLVVEGQPAITVTEASVLMNFLRIDWMDLIASHSHDFTATDHVADEISDRYPDQQQRFASGIDAGAISQMSITGPEEISFFGSLSASGRLGSGECSAIATIQVRRTDQALRILTTQDLMVSMIRKGLLDTAEADSIKDDWATRHRFRLKLHSFRDVCV